MEITARDGEQRTVVGWYEKRYGSLADAQDADLINARLGGFFERELDNPHRFETPRERLLYEALSALEERIVSLETK